MRARRLRIVERVLHAHSVEWHLLHTVHLGRSFNARCLEHGRGDVDDVMMLTAKLTFGPDTLGPVNYQRISDATIVHRLLEVPERRIACHRPAGVVVVIGLRRPPLVVALEVLIPRCF